MQMNTLLRRASVAAGLAFVRAHNVIPQPTHDAAWWEAKTKGFDFSSEDRVDPDKFNRVIWEGLMGGRPYPTRRSEPKSEGAAGASSILLMQSELSCPLLLPLTHCG